MRHGICVLHRETHRSYAMVPGRPLLQLPEALPDRSSRLQPRARHILMSSFVSLCVLRNKGPSMRESRMKDAQGYKPELCTGLPQPCIGDITCISQLPRQTSTPLEHISFKSQALEAEGQVHTLPHVCLAYCGAQRTTFRSQSSFHPGLGG